MLLISRIYNTILALVIIFFIVSLPSDLLWDRDNYLNYAANSEEILKTYDSFTKLIFNDYFFLKLNYFLSIYMSSEKIVLFLLISCLALNFYLISRHALNSFMFTIGIILSILIVPILHLEVVAIRQFLATVIALLALSFSSKKNKVALCFFVASLIHSSFFIFLFLFVIDNFIFEKFSKNKRFILNLSVILVLAFSYIFVGSYLGFRQIELYSSYDGAVGGGSLIVVILLLVYLFIYYGHIKYDLMYNFVVQGFLLFLIFYIFANSSISARLLESILPAFILLLVAKFRRIEVIVIFIIFLAYSFVWIKGGQYIIFEAPKEQVEYYYLEKL